MPLTVSEEKDKGIDRLQQDIRKGLPNSAYEYVTVTFPSTANLDAIISTSLRPANPEDIYFKVVDLKFMAAPATTPCIYRDGSSTRKPWGTGFIVLRCNVASVVATLELTTKRI